MCSSGVLRCDTTPHHPHHTSCCASTHRWSCDGQSHTLLLCVPAELCQQVLAVVRGLAKGAPLRSAALTGGRPWHTQREALDQVSRRAPSTLNPDSWTDAGNHGTAHIVCGASSC